VYVAEVSDNSGSDYIDERMCADCYNNQVDTVWLSEKSHGNAQIKKSALDSSYLHAVTRTPHWHIDDDLTPAQIEDNLHARMHHRVFDEYYEEKYSGLDHNHMLLRKSAFGYGQRGWYEAKVEVTTPIADKITRMLDYLICESGQGFFRPHKKLGRVQPFQELFADLCHFYARNKCFDGRERIEGRYPVAEIAEYKQLWTDELSVCKTDEERMRTFTRMTTKYGTPYVDFYVDHLNRDKLRLCVKSRKLPNGRPLIQAVNKIINTMEKQSKNEPDFVGVWEVLDGNLKRFWNDYCTNGLTVELPVSIGFGANAHNKVQSFNESCSSCQSHEYIEGLGFNHISMQCNPHLFLLIHHPEHPEQIIGRSVIRFWYARYTDISLDNYNEIDYTKLYVAPSRLYLTEYTHVKRDVYTQVFKVVRKWIDEHGSNWAGGANAEIIAYCRSKHDDYSIASYLNNGIDAGNQVRLTAGKEMSLATEYYYPVWLEKPDTDALWTYYNDEYQTSEATRVGESKLSSFAIRETYEGTVRIVEKQE
tara:strand:- start:4863 stop:6461 length:1599 start_codon:yes stop_codon:yes gene_type:complete